MISINTFRVKVRVEKSGKTVGLSGEPSERAGVQVCKGEGNSFRTQVDFPVDLALNKKNNLSVEYMASSRAHAIRLIPK
jgi:hypothetical protein